jgi:hypothetical protein
VYGTAVEDMGAKATVKLHLAEEEQGHKAIVLDDVASASNSLITTKRSRRVMNLGLVVVLLLTLLLFIWLNIAYPNMKTVFADKNTFVRVYCNTLVQQNYKQIYQMFDSSFPYLNRAATIEKTTVTSENTYVQLASSVDSRQGKVTNCRIASTTRMVTHSQVNTGACGANICTSDSNSLTTTFAFLLKITRQRNSPYSSRILIDVTTDTDSPSDTPSDVITTIETL